MLQIKKALCIMINIIYTNANNILEAPTICWKLGKKCKTIKKC